MRNGSRKPNIDPLPIFLALLMGCSFDTQLFKRYALGKHLDRHKVGFEFEVEIGFGKELRTKSEAFEFQGLHLLKNILIRFDTDIVQQPKGQLAMPILCNQKEADLQLLLVDIEREARQFSHVVDVDDTKRLGIKFNPARDLRERPQSL